MGNAAPAAGQVHLSLITSPPSPDLTEPQIALLASRLKQALGVFSIARFSGAAGVHVALDDARNRLMTGACDRVCLLGADSSLCVPRVFAGNRRRRNVWVPLEPAPSEAAAAVLVAQNALPGEKPLATIVDVMTTQAASHDYNDEIVDGVGLTYLLRKLPNRGGVPMVFGPTRHEALRQREWSLASARARHHLGPPYAIHDVESDIGDVGAAAGAVHLAYGIACNHHRVVDPQIPPGSPFYSWAISSDGTRGVALLEGAKEGARS